MSKTKTKKKTKIFLCEKCARAYKTEMGLKKHMEEKHPELAVTDILKNGKVVLKQSQELFLQYYVLNEETRNNGTRSYALAYGYKLDEMSKVRELVEGVKKVGKEFVKVEVKKIGTSEFDKASSVCATEAVNLLLNPKIEARRIQLLNSLLKDEIVDGELAKVIMIADPTESAKMSGIKEYNALRQRVVKREDIRIGLLGVVKHVYEEANDMDKKTRE